MMKTSMFALHETDRESGGTISMCELHVTDRDCLRMDLRLDVWSGSEGRTELPPPRRRDDRRDKVLGLLIVRWGFAGICRNQATESMLWGVVDSFQKNERSSCDVSSPPVPRLAPKPGR
jgi:hypothetical protein